MGRRLVSGVVGWANASLGHPHADVGHCRENFCQWGTDVPDRFLVAYRETSGGNVHQCDVIVHLAAAVGGKLITEQPLRSFITNIRGSEIVVDAAHRCCREIMVVSTSEIYGKNSQVPLAEEADRVLGSPTVSRWAYSTAKAVDEILANVYHRARGLPTITVRSFNTIGPRQSGAYGMVIPRLVDQALRGEPLMVHGDGSQSRCFAHVTDVGEALLLLLDFPAGRRVPDTTRLTTITDWRPLRDLAWILSDVIGQARTEQAQQASFSVPSLGGRV